MNAKINDGDEYDLSATTSNEEKYAKVKFERILESGTVVVQSVCHTATKYGTTWAQRRLVLCNQQNLLLCCY